MLLTLGPAFFPVIVACRQLHQELLGAYFRSVTVELKSSSPSEFSGDMSGFGSPTFRDRVKKLWIRDGDPQRRAKIGAAFKYARILYDDKGAPSSRKGAYYFGAC